MIQCYIAHGSVGVVVETEFLRFIGRAILQLPRIIACGSTHDRRLQLAAWNSHSVCLSVWFRPNGY